MTAVSGLPRDDRWHALARLAIRDDIYGSLRAVCFDVLAVGRPTNPASRRSRSGEQINGSRVHRAKRTLTEIYHGDARDLATLSVAARQIRSMTRTTGKAPVAEPNGFTTGVRVRWSDIDMYQHINHATMVTILEEARVDFSRALRRGHRVDRVADPRGADALQRPTAPCRFAAEGHDLDQAAARRRLHPWATRFAVGGAAPDSSRP